MVKSQTGMHVYTRQGNETVEAPFEKAVVVPMLDDNEPARHAWADARFATDIMAEHALFFALLMPPEVAAQERAEALRFGEVFTRLNSAIDGSPPPERGDVGSFVNRIVEEIKPFIDFKAKLGDAQREGRLRSLVWPLFFDHAQHEAERWSRRLTAIAHGEPEFDRTEVVEFWSNIMDEHARFVAHLLDPDEFDLIEKAMKTSSVFASLGNNNLGGVVHATLQEPATVIGSLLQNPETDAVMSAAQTILDFKTESARNIEAGRIKSIIDPRLADHVRREALKFVDELKRVG